MPVLNNKHLTVLKETWQIATQLLEVSVDLRMVTVGDVRNKAGKKETICSLNISVSVLVY
jgi:mannose/fructose/N-acetylgalactosamine-specific phosphotransferase system component IIB